ncbi:hypothetical protein GN956_G24724 [Arapaima gigas]
MPFKSGLLLQNFRLRNELPRFHCLQIKRGPYKRAMRRCDGPLEQPTAALILTSPREARGLLSSPPVLQTTEAYFPCESEARV